MPASGDRSTNAFLQFFRTEAAGGAVLVTCAVAAIIVANSPWAERYHHFWETPIGGEAAGHGLSLTLHQWINDGLMAIFFLLVGLEIKREAIAGELSSLRQAALPIAAAIGGMIGARADLLGGERRWRRVARLGDSDGDRHRVRAGGSRDGRPARAGRPQVFLAALAIVDDIGAVLVIAMFYTGSLNLFAIGAAGVCLAVLVVLNVMHVERLTPYLLVGLVLWFFVHQSGIHATIAGVLLAFTIPAGSRINTAQFSAEARRLLDEFDHGETGDFEMLTSARQQDAVFGLKRASTLATAPLLRLQHGLHWFTAFVVMPLFAFSNVGVTLHGASADRVTLAVILGLAIGKPLGITVAAWLVVATGLATRPQRVGWMALHGCAWLGGIGFTMSLFISMLAFEGTPQLATAKIGILLASLAAGIVGALVIRRGSTQSSKFEFEVRSSKSEV
jgi:NhaA family Na+:H+ antiporter